MYILGGVSGFCCKSITAAKSMTVAFQNAANGGKLVYVGLVKADISFADPEFRIREMTLMISRKATWQEEL